LNGKIQIVGVGPGAAAYLTPAALAAIRGCDVLAGGPRNLEPFRDFGKEIIAIDGNLERLGVDLSRQAGTKKVVVLVSGDPGIFSIQKLLRRQFAAWEIETIPGISALQYFCGKLGIGWDDLRIVSLHARDTVDLAAEIRTYARVCVFTGGMNSPGAICRRLQAAGIDQVRVTVGERLSYPEERIIRGDLGRIGALEFDSLALMLIERTVPVESTRLDLPIPGLPDEYFVRGGAVPMTREEVRAVVISKLRLRNNDIVYDIGAGTGSVTVEAALRCRGGLVCAIERDPAAAALVSQNVGQFGLTNVRVITGTAPAALVGLPEPNRIFIGGSDGKLPEMITQFRNYQKAFRVVAAAVTLETAVEALESFADNGFTAVEAVNLAISRSQPVGGKHLMKASNPVTIISAVQGGE
jgi:precorrin-6Y C5,15-methyltransferase (decarboxylating)